MVYTRGFATTKIIVINFFFFYPPITLAMSKAVQLFLSRILTSAPDFMRSLATALNLKQEVTKLSKCRPHTLSYITQSRLLILSVSLFRDVIFKLWIFFFEVLYILGVILMVWRLKFVKKTLNITGKCKVFLLVWSLQKEYITVWKQYRVSMIFFFLF